MYGMGKVKTQRRRAGSRLLIVAAEDGMCARCTQPIVAGERVMNERGFASHRDCVRLGVAVWRSRGRQVSDGWGSECVECGAVIERGMRWSRVTDGVAHAECVQR